VLVVALLVCRDRSCRAAFEADGSREAITALCCEDCDGPLEAVGWADTEPRDRGNDRVAVQRAA
jgi:transposase